MRLIIQRLTHVDIFDKDHWNKYIELIIFKLEY